MSDVLSRYVCTVCENTTLSFKEDDVNCMACNSPTRKHNKAISIGASTGHTNGTQFDSLSTIDAWVDECKEQDAIDKANKVTEAVRSGRDPNKKYGE